MRGAEIFAVSSRSGPWQKACDPLPKVVDSLCLACSRGGRKLRSLQPGLARSLGTKDPKGTAAVTATNLNIRDGRQLGEFAIIGSQGVNISDRARVERANGEGFAPIANMGS